MTLAPSPAIGRSAALAGIGFMLVAVLLFGLNSAAGKWLVVKYPVGEFLALRSVMTLLVLVPMIWRAGRAAFTNVPKPGLQFLRVLFSSVEVAMFFWAVQYLPLADTTTFYLAGPIYVTALSVWFLGERVGWRRWTAVLIGFVGVLIALRPSSSTLTLPALIALSGSFIYALVLITTRMLREANATLLMTLYFIGTFLLGMVTFPFGWIVPDGSDLLFFVALGVSNVVAQFCVIRSLTLASASVVVPYQYTLLIWSVVFGFMMFGEIPDGYTIGGAAIIIAAGLYIFWRERVTARGVAPAPGPQ